MAISRHVGGPKCVPALGRAFVRRAGPTSPALLLLAMHQLGIRSAVRRATCRTELSADRTGFTCGSLWARLIVSVTFVRIGDGRESSSRSPCRMYQLGWRKGWLCSREQVGS